MDSKMKTSVYTKKLRARLKVLMAQRQKALTRFNSQFSMWRADLRTWMLSPSNAAAAVKEITIASLGAASGWRYQEHWAAKLLKGAPMPPTKSEYDRLTKNINQIRKRLHHLSVTGQATVTVSERESNDFFVDPEPKEKTALDDEDDS